MEITINIDETALAEELLPTLSQQVAENDVVTEAIQEIASMSGYEAGQESGAEAGFDAGREAASETDGPGITWENLWYRMDNEFTGRSYESGCHEWRTPFNAFEWAMAESVRLGPDHDHQGFLNKFRADLLSEIQAGTGESTRDQSALDGLDSETARSNVTALNSRVKDLELLVAGLGQALLLATGLESGDGFNLSPLRSYATTAERHEWPAWMDGVVTNTKA